MNNEFNKAYNELVEKIKNNSKEDINFFKTYATYIRNMNSKNAQKSKEIIDIMISYIKHVDSDKNTLIHYTCINSSFEIFNELLKFVKYYNEQKEDNQNEIIDCFNIQNNNGETPLHIALKTENLTTQINNKENINDMISTMICGIYSGGVTNNIILKRTDLTKQDSNSDTPLHIVTSTLNTDAFNTMFAPLGCADVNDKNIKNDTYIDTYITIQNGKGETPLHIAVNNATKTRTGKVFLKKMLEYIVVVNPLNSGDTNNQQYIPNLALSTKDASGNTPLHIAVNYAISENGDDNILVLLLDNIKNGTSSYAPFTATDSNGNTVLHIAINDVSILNKLLEKIDASNRIKITDPTNDPLSIQDSSGNTPLHAFINIPGGMFGPRTIKPILAKMNNNDPALSIKNNEGYTPLLLAITKNHKNQALNILGKVDYSNNPAGSINFSNVGYIVNGIELSPVVYAETLFKKDRKYRDIYNTLNAQYASLNTDFENKTKITPLSLSVSNVKNINSNLVNVVNNMSQNVKTASQTINSGVPTNPNDIKISVNDEEYIENIKNFYTRALNTKWTVLTNFSTDLKKLLDNNSFDSLDAEDKRTLLNYFLVADFRSRNKKCSQGCNTRSEMVILLLEKLTEVDFKNIKEVNDNYININTVLNGQNILKIGLISFIKNNKKNEKMTEELKRKIIDSEIINEKDLEDPAVKNDNIIPISNSIVTNTNQNNTEKIKASMGSIANVLQKDAYNRIYADANKLYQTLGDYFITGKNIIDSSGNEINGYTLLSDNIKIKYKDDADYIYYNSKTRDIHVLAGLEDYKEFDSSDIFNQIRLTINNDKLRELIQGIITKVSSNNDIIIAYISLVLLSKKIIKKENKELYYNIFSDLLTKFNNTNPLNILIGKYNTATNGDYKHSLAYFVSLLIYKIIHCGPDEYTKEQCIMTYNDFTTPGDSDNISLDRQKIIEYLNLLVKKHGLNPEYVQIIKYLTMPKNHIEQVIEPSMQNITSSLSNDFINRLADQLFKLLWGYFKESQGNKSDGYALLNKYKDSPVLKVVFSEEMNNPLSKNRMPGRNMVGGVNPSQESADLLESIILNIDSTDHITVSGALHALNNASSSVLKTLKNSTKNADINTALSAIANVANKIPDLSDLLKNVSKRITLPKSHSSPPPSSQVNNSASSVSVSATSPTDTIKKSMITVAGILHKNVSEKNSSQSDPVAKIQRGLQNAVSTLQNHVTVTDNTRSSIITPSVTNVSSSSILNGMGNIMSALQNSVVGTSNSQNSINDKIQTGLQNVALALHNNVLKTVESNTKANDEAIEKIKASMGSIANALQKDAYDRIYADSDTLYSNLKRFFVDNKLITDNNGNEIDGYTLLADNITVLENNAQEYAKFEPANINIPIKNNYYKNIYSTRKLFQIFDKEYNNNIKYIDLKNLLENIITKVKTNLHIATAYMFFVFIATNIINNKIGEYVKFIFYPIKDSENPLNILVDKYNGANNNDTENPSYKNNIGLFIAELLLIVISCLMHKCTIKELVNPTDSGKQRKNIIDIIEYLNLLVKKHGLKPEYVPIIKYLTMPKNHIEQVIKPSMQNITSTLSNDFINRLADQLFGLLRDNFITNTANKSDGYALLNKYKDSPALTIIFSEKMSQLLAQRSGGGKMVGGVDPAPNQSVLLLEQIVLNVDSNNTASITGAINALYSASQDIFNQLRRRNTYTSIKDKLRVLNDYVTDYSSNIDGLKETWAGIKNKIYYAKDYYTRIKTGLSSSNQNLTQIQLIKTGLTTAVNVLSNNVKSNKSTSQQPPTAIESGMIHAVNLMSTKIYNDKQTSSICKKPDPPKPTSQKDIIEAGLVSAVNAVSDSVRSKTNNYNPNNPPPKEYKIGITRKEYDSSIDKDKTKIITYDITPEYNYPFTYRTHTHPSVDQANTMLARLKLSANNQKIPPELVHTENYFNNELSTTSYYDVNNPNALDIPNVEIRINDDKIPHNSVSNANNMYNSLLGKPPQPSTTTLPKKVTYNYKQKFNVTTGGRNKTTIKNIHGIPPKHHNTTIRKH